MDQNETKPTTDGARWKTERKTRTPLGKTSRTEGPRRGRQEDRKKQQEEDQPSIVRRVLVPEGAKNTAIDIKRADSAPFEPGAAESKTRNPFRLRRITVTKRTLSVIERHYPAILEDPFLRAFLQYVLFNHHATTLNSYWDAADEVACGVSQTALEWSARLGQHNTGIPVGARLIARMAGKLKQFKQGKFVALPYLEKARDELFHGRLSWNEAQWQEHEPRQVRTIAGVWIHPEVAEAVEKELDRNIDKEKDRVYFDTGEPYTRQKRQSERTRFLEDAEAENLEILRRKGRVEIPARVRSYLNGLPPNGFTKAMHRHMDAAYEVLRSMPQETPKERRSKGYARAVLRFVTDQPKPVYEAKPKTHRLFAAKSLQALNRGIRKVLVQDWISLDLVSAHLAICAKLWGVEEVLSFLRGGGRIWDELLPYMRLDKDPVKQALYALMYGGGVRKRSGVKTESRLVRVFEGHGVSPGKAKVARRKFMKHPLIRAMYEARQRRIADIKRSGYMTDCFGVRTYLDESKGVTALSLLSAEASAVEMLLLWPAFELAEQHQKDFKIMLYTFDGIYVNVVDRSRKTQWIDRIIEAVNAQAIALGIPTRLEAED